MVLYFENLTLNEVYFRKIISCFNFFIFDFFYLLCVTTGATENIWFPPYVNNKPLLEIISKNIGWTPSTRRIPSLFIRYLWHLTTNPPIPSSRIVLNVEVFIRKIKLYPCLPKKEDFFVIISDCRKFILSFIS